MEKMENKKNAIWIYLKKYSKIFPFLILIPLALFKFGFWLKTEPIVNERSLSYIQPAVELYQNGTYSNPETFRRTPVYPLMLAGSFKVFGLKFKPITFIQSLLGVGLVIVSMLIAGYLWDNSAFVTLSGILVGTHQRINFYEAAIQSETLFLFLAAVTFLISLKIIKGDVSKKTLLFCGVIGGAASLCRPEFSLFLIVPAIFFIKAKAGWEKTGWFIGSWSGLVILWMARNLLIFGCFSLTPMGAITSLQTSGPFIDFKSSSYKEVKSVYKEILDDHKGNHKTVVNRTIEKLVKEQGMDFAQATKLMAGLGGETFRQHPFKYLWASRKNFSDFAVSINNAGKQADYFSFHEQSLLFSSIIGIILVLIFSRGPQAWFLLASIIYLVFANCLVEIGYDERRSLEIIPLLSLFSAYAYVFGFYKISDMLKSKLTKQSNLS